MMTTCRATATSRSVASIQKPVWVGIVGLSISRKATAATLNLGTVVQNQGTKAETSRVRWQIMDAEGKTVATAEAQPQQVAADGSATFTTSAKLPDASLWSVETPHLYSAVVTVEA